MGLDFRELYARLMLRIWGVRIQELGGSNLGIGGFRD